MLFILLYGPEGNQRSRAVQKRGWRNDLGETELARRSEYAVAGNRSAGHGLRLVSIRVGQEPGWRSDVESAAGYGITGCDHLAGVRSAGCESSVRGDLLQRRDRNQAGTVEEGICRFGGWYFRRCLARECWRRAARQPMCGSSMGRREAWPRGR